MNEEGTHFTPITHLPSHSSMPRPAGVYGFYDMHPSDNHQGLAELLQRTKDPAGPEKLEPLCAPKRHAVLCFYVASESTGCGGGGVVNLSAIGKSKM
ncbi:hypothetical protein OC844_008014, partial [Tilletia horrida]